MNNFFSEKAFQSTDPKGRLVLPKDVRDAFKIKKGDTLVLVPNLSDPAYLEIRTTEQWAHYRETLAQEESSEKKKDSIRYAKMFKAEVAVDGQGRILIPQQLREACQLDGTVAVIDMELYIEVWCKANVERKYNDMINAFRETSNRAYK
jgi:MraZ protein